MLFSFRPVGRRFYRAPHVPTNLSANASVLKVMATNEDALIVLGLLIAMKNSDKNIKRKPRLWSKYWLQKRN